MRSFHAQCERCGHTWSGEEPRSLKIHSPVFDADTRQVQWTGPEFAPARELRIACPECRLLNSVVIAASFPERPGPELAQAEEGDLSPAERIKRKILGLVA
jgi:hypothetical protein